MKKEIKTTNLVHAPIDKVWAKVAPGTNMDKWMPIIATCKVDGNQRTCGTVEGQTLNETILQSDDDQKVFQYRIDQQNMMPIDNIIGTMTFAAKNAETTEMQWDVSFDISEENAPALPEIQQNIEGLYAMAATALAEYAHQ